MIATVRSATMSKTHTTKSALKGLDISSLGDSEILRYFILFWNTSMRQQPNDCIKYL